MNQNIKNEKHVINRRDLKIEEQSRENNKHSKEVEEFRKEMKKVKAKFKIITYKNATHAFTNPKATEIGKKYNIPISYDESADKKSWNELISFIKEAL